MLGCVVAGESSSVVLKSNFSVWDLKPRWLVSRANAGGVVNGTSIRSAWGLIAGQPSSGARQHAMSSDPSAPSGSGCHGENRCDGRTPLIQDGRFLGGLIMPGFGLMYQA